MNCIFEKIFFGKYNWNLKDTFSNYKVQNPTIEREEERREDLKLTTTFLFVKTTENHLILSKPWTQKNWKREEVRLRSSQLLRLLQLSQTIDNSQRCQPLSRPIGLRLAHLEQVVKCLFNSFAGSNSKQTLHLPASKFATCTIGCRGWNV